MHRYSIMINIISKFVLIHLTTIALLVGSSNGATSQGLVKSVHGDWQIRCEHFPGDNNEHCALIQQVVAEDELNGGLSVLILKTSDKKRALIRIVAPLGVIVPRRLSVKIDSGQPYNLRFIKCLPNGCIAEAELDEKVIAELRSGKTATFIVFKTPEEGIGFPLNIEGFGEGFDKLP
jgi:invasion protein IalB